MTRGCGSPGCGPHHTTTPLLLNPSSHTVFAGVSTKNQVLKPNLDSASLHFLSISPSLGGLLCWDITQGFSPPKSGA